MDYQQINKDSWNKRTDAHWESGFYDVQGFLDGKSSLNDIELSLLGNIQGKKLLHLQCHFGQDTLSLGRMGADVTGVDLSDRAIARANELSGAAGIPAEFICCDLYDLPAHLHDTFDIVFSSYGTVGWLPDLDRWASLINRYLKPGGRFIFAEFHPVVWMFDNDFTTVQYNYFKDEAIVENESGTYANREAPISHQSVTWNHSLSELMGSLLKQNMRNKRAISQAPRLFTLQLFNATEEFEPQKFRIAKWK
ncbi:MAG: class I SAM-dependent methyltransferase [Ferruginibacter sp.]